MEIQDRKFITPWVFQVHKGLKTKGDTGNGGYAKAQMHSVKRQGELLHFLI
jgi:hypothetical protein